MITVRRAVATDVPWLLAQLRAFDQFVGAGRALFPDEAYAQGVLAGLLAEHPVFVATREDERLGFIAGTCAPHPFNPTIRVLSELFWWVDPAHRGTSAGARLLAMFCAYGDVHADWIVMTLEARSPVNPATLERRGFKLTERNYLLEVR